MLSTLIICLVGAMLCALLIIIPPRKPGVFTILLALVAISASVYGAWQIARSALLNS